MIGVATMSNTPQNTPDTKEPVDGGDELQNLIVELEAGTSYQKDLNGWLLDENDFRSIAELIQAHEQAALLPYKQLVEKSIQCLRVAEYDETADAIEAKLHLLQPKPQVGEGGEA